MSESIHRGGCQCGAIRFVATGAPVDIGYCHCRMCQRSAGAPVVAWGGWESRRFRLTSREQPVVYKSSATGERWFCGQCGSSFLFRESGRPQEVDISLATLDDPSALPPHYHIWTSSRLPWFETADDLPRHGEERDAG